MRVCILASTLLTALTVSVSAEPPLDELSPCSAAVRAFASKDAAQIRLVTEFMDRTFEQLDQEHTRSGEAGILNATGLKNVLEFMVRGYCSQHQGSTIYIEAVKAYRSTRAVRVHTDAEP
jgi:hypothetical protein